MKKTQTIIFRLLPPLLFISFCLFVLIGIRKEYLVEVAGMTPFYLTPTYTSQLMSQGIWGIATWCSSAICACMTQPLLGASILTLLLTLLALLLQCCSKLKWAWAPLCYLPSLFLLGNFTSRGYELYTFKESGTEFNWLIIAIVLVALAALLRYWWTKQRRKTSKTIEACQTGKTRQTGKSTLSSKTTIIYFAIALLAMGLMGWHTYQRTFKDENYRNILRMKQAVDKNDWQKVLDKLQPGDYVIIQFGHNDEKPQPARHTDPGSTFDYNYAKFIRETREHGGIPVVMNCVARRNWQASPDASKGRGEPMGTQIDDEALRNTTAMEAPLPLEGSGEVLLDTHGLYAVAPRDVAQRMHALFIDANKITHDLEQSLGPEGSKKLHMWYKPGEHPALPDGRQDNTHYNIYGAHQVAKLLADALCQEIPLLTKYRTNDKPCKMEK